MVKIRVKVLWVVIPYNDAVGYEHFTLKMEAARSSKCWYPITTVHGVRTQRTT
jgi:hypothetical protein